MASIKEEFGRFLRSERFGRKLTNIEEYGKQFWKSTEKFAASYYRSLEAGRKLPRLSKGKELCEALQLDKVLFFKKLVRSQLADAGLNKEEVDEILPSPDTETEQEKIERLEAEVHELKEQKKIAQIEKQVSESEEFVIYGNDLNSEGLDWIKFIIYMCEQVSFDELDKYLEQHQDILPKGITRDQIIYDFSRFGLIAVNTEKRFIQRRARFLTNFDLPNPELKVLQRRRVYMNGIQRGLKKSFRLPKNENLNADMRDMQHSIFYFLTVGEDTIRLLNEWKQQLIHICEMDQEKDLEYGTQPYMVGYFISSMEEFNIKEM